MTRAAIVSDRNGKPVRVGTRVRVLSIPVGVTERLEPEEVPRVLSMVGEEFEVDEIDEYGCAWVTKCWKVERENQDAHSLALSANEMEVV